MSKKGISTEKHGSDREMVARVANGEEAAQHRMLERVWGRVRRVCRTLLGESADADDAFQLSMIEILKASGNYRGESSLERWADRITSRTAIKMIQKNRTQNLRIVSSEHIESLGIAPTGEVSQESLPRKIQEYLDGVSESLRTALVLRHGLGYSVNEIAELTGVSPNTVKDRLIRGRRAMRHIIQRERNIGRPRAVGGVS